MSVIAAVFLFTAWSCMGWAVLNLAKPLDGMLRVLLAPAVGASVATITVVAANLLGFPIDHAVLLIGLVFVVAIGVMWRHPPPSWRSVGVLHASVLGFNILTAGIGLILFGSAWQGLINGDATTNSMGAQYFLTHSFFAQPLLDTVANGTDYSPLDSLLYVSGGQRFGDVMLLGLSARVFGVAPDEVYMAHTMALRCALVTTLVPLVYRPGQSRARLCGLAIVFSMSPLASYAYLNQLMSQIGGMVELFAAVILFYRIVTNEELTGLALVPLAVLIAALCESYPEALPMLGLFLVSVVVCQAWLSKPIALMRLAKKFALCAILVLICISRALPNIAFAVLNILAWGAQGPHNAHELNMLFPYGFTPDFFPLLIGFQILGEGLREPAESFACAAGLVVLVWLLWHFWKRRAEHVLLTAITLASALLFAALYFQKNGFGLFKMMIMVQPVVYAILATALLDILARRNLYLMGAATAAALGLVRSDLGYIGKSLLPYGEISHLADLDLLARLSSLAQSSTDGIVLESPSFLLGKFSLLRTRKQPVVTEENFMAAYASGDPSATLQSNPAAPWLPQFPEFVRGLPLLYAKEYRNERFACPAPDQVDFEIRRNRLAERPVIVPGPALVPLNKMTAAGPLAPLEHERASTFLIFRPSSAGGYYRYGVSRIGMFSAERDFADSSANIAAVGQMLLLELGAPASEPIRIRMSLTRTAFGGAASTLHPIRLYGEQPVDLEVVGGGSLDLISGPVRPCRVAGRDFVLLDFGDVEYIRRADPLVYRMLGVEYLPDVRRMSAFVRDISVVDAREASSPAGPARSWISSRFKAEFEYSGLYEDGWISSEALIRPAANTKRLVMHVTVPGEAANGRPLSLAVQVGNAPVERRSLTAGDNEIAIEFTGNGGNAVKFSVDHPYTLPGGDSRRVIGLLKSISVQ